MKNKKPANKVTRSQIIDLIVKIAKIVLLFIGVVFFIFALFSGAEEYGGGIVGIIYNFPNTLPWILVLIVTYVAWKWELVGGILVFLLGVGMFFFFEIYATKSLFVFSVLCLPFLLIGLILATDALLKKRIEKKQE